jgi:hypothetical protein
LMMFTWLWKCVFVDFFLTEIKCHLKLRVVTIKTFMHNIIMNLFFLFCQLTIIILWSLLFLICYIGFVWPDGIQNIVFFYVKLDLMKFWKNFILILSFLLKMVRWSYGLEYFGWHSNDLSSNLIQNNFFFVFFFVKSHKMSYFVMFLFLPSMF